MNAPEYREQKVRAGNYNLFRRDPETGEEVYVGFVYRMPYANMSKSWRAVWDAPDSTRHDRPICNGKAEAIRTLKAMIEEA